MRAQSETQASEPSLVQRNQRRILSRPDTGLGWDAGWQSERSWLVWLSLLLSLFIFSLILFGFLVPD
jgi:hypothetical protein